MKILFVASEVEGFIKTGGLADVAYALPKALVALGHDVRIIFPAYKKIQQTWINWPCKGFSTKVSFFNTENVVAHYGELDDIKALAINHPKSFDRDGLYDDGEAAFDDNAYRYAVFSKAALDWCKVEGWQPDIVHTNDWQSAMACFYLHEHHREDEFFANTRSVLSIHNGAYQMHCGQQWYTSIGIDDRFYNPTDFEDSGHLNVLKGAIGFADGVSTVSPGYASELQTPTGGHGIDFKYREITHPVIGILNGCDYDQWSPDSDAWIPAKFDANDMAGKDICKQALQEELNLEVDSEAPLLASICRLVDQKGIHLLIPVILDLMKNHSCQVAILGSGEKTLADQLSFIEKQYPHRFRFINGYDVGLSHRIEAGADAFLMPSVFEPCGLNQIYSLRYGTLPLVREVGGLQDSVCRLSNSERNLKTATGFMFSELSEQALLEETKRMLNVYINKKSHWKAMQKNAMKKRFSWKKSAIQYQDLYKELLSKPRVKHRLSYQE